MVFFTWPRSSLFYRLQNLVNFFSPKVIARITGGLGNQLFVYATARRLALVNNSELVLDDVSGFVRDYEYQRHYQLDHFHIPCRKTTLAERLEPFSKVRRYLKRRWNQCLPFEKRKYITRESIDFEPRLLDLKSRGTVYLEGLWQSEGYFSDAENVIRHDLRIQQPTDPMNLATADQIRKEIAIAVHVRFFDQGNANGSNNAPGDYYRRAVEIMEASIPRAHYFLFSDQPLAARERLPLPDNRVTLIKHNQGDESAYADLWLMSKCQHFIIANSTFSWWGAWLAESEEKIIIAPGFEKRDGCSYWGFDGLLPDSWIKV